MICTKCKADKDPEDFHVRRSSKLRKRQPDCKSCRKISGKEYKEKCGKRNREYIWNYLEARGCIDCGERNIIVLEFNHLRDKKYNISDMVYKYTESSLKKIKEEIAKCEILCANCHVLKTAVQLNWHITRRNEL